MNNNIYLNKKSDFFKKLPFHSLSTLSGFKNNADQGINILFVYLFRM